MAIPVLYFQESSAIGGKLDSGDRPVNMILRNANRLFWALVVIGFLERLLFAYLVNPSQAHSDEHQQYIEQAYRQLHDGYGYTFWEQDRGMRHLLYPWCLSGLLAGLEHLGLD